MTKRPTHSESGYPEQRPDGPGNPEAYLKQVTTYAPPPAKFDSLKASARELARYGFPRRPDPRTEPERAALWGKAYSRPIKPVQAAIEIDRVLLNSPRRRRVRVHDGRFAPGGWGGVIAQTSAFAFSPSEPANMVYGEWSVPTMQPDFDNPKTSMTVGFWVGLEGIR